MLRVAVVGAGPSGIYTAEGLLLSGPDVSVDLYDRLPTPYGLVRYGVAPDHLQIKAVITSLHGVLTRPRLRFLGNVAVGEHITIDELREHYDAIVLTYGAAADRRLGIPGEDLPGSRSATDFVAFYNGHPDSAPDAFALDAQSVVVIGVGNVAVDVARILTKDVDALVGTDLPQHVIDVLGKSAVTDVHMVGRRGPAHATFTHKELRELGEQPGVDVIVDPAELELDAAEQLLIASHPGHRRNVETLRTWAARTPTGAPRRLHLRFRLRPVELLGTEAVTGVRLERTMHAGDGAAVGTGETLDVPAQLVLRSVGYRGRPMPGVAFAQSTGTIPHTAGRVSAEDRIYAAGWIKRGPSGLIGSNRRDAHETVASLLADAATWPRPDRDPHAVDTLLAARGVKPVDWLAWEAIDAAERALGASHDKAREKLAAWSELLQAAGAAR